MKKFFSLLTSTYQRWMKNDPFQQSAIIAYYTLFSLPSFFVIIISIAGYFFGKSEIQHQVVDGLSDIVGMDTALSVEKLITNVDVRGETTIALIISIGVLVFGATSAFFQLKKSMNRIWSVREKRANVLMMILDRLLSLALILGIGLMVVASVILTTIFTALGDYVEEYAPALSSSALYVFNFLISYVFIAFLFTLIYKLLPDVKIKWRSTMVGASLTTVLFLIAEYALGIYFSKSDPASVFGGASSVILIMLWIYYACLILFFGAEFTFQYTLRKGEHVVPGKYGEPAFIQDLKDLKDQKIYTDEQRILLEKMTKQVEKSL